MTGPLHWIGNTVRELLLHIPLSAARGLFVAVPLVLMIWVLRLPAVETVPPDRPSHWTEDLRLWAWLALAIQVVIYCVL